MDLHHRRPNSNPRDDAFVGKLVLAGIMRHVGRRAAHVEADQVIVLVRSACRDHSDNAARRAGQDRVLAAEGARFGETAVRLHEVKTDFRRQTGSDAVDVASEHRREIRIDNGGVAAPDQLDQRRDLVADRQLGKAELTSNRLQPFLMLAVPPAMHEDDCQGLDSGFADFNQTCAGAIFIEGNQHLSIDADPFVDLDDALVQHRRQDDVAGEDFRSGLVANAKRVPEAAGDCQGQALAFPLEQGVRSDGGPNSDVGDRPAFVSDDPADRLQCGVAISRIFRQQLLDP